MQDVSSIEVQKGPGSINTANATGGVIQLITKSVFKEDDNRLKIGAGNDNQRNVNLKLHEAFSESDFASMTFSQRNIDNSWRDNNEFDTTQLSTKYGHIFKDDSTVETELSYTESNLNLPASMTKAEFEEFKRTGEQHNTTDKWQHSARNSKIWALNSKYEKEVGNVTYKPRVYFNTWEHFHPVTGIINDSDDNVVLGTDLEFNVAHKLFSNDAVFVGGVTLKEDETNDAKKYQYADVQTDGTGKIVKTLSNRKGSLASTEDSQTLLYGAYLMESFKPTEKWSTDISTRIDKLTFDISGNEITKYNYSTQKYAAGEGEYTIDKSFTLFSAKLGNSYAITPYTNIYVSVATANQAPTTSELGDNENLKKTQSTNYEIGLKTRIQDLSYDVALFQNDVENEIIQIKDANGNTIFDNAGETKKRGLELNLEYDVTSHLKLGGGYTYSQFTFETFNESVRNGATTTLVSRAGNYLPYIPENQYSLFAAYNMDNGFKSRITTKSYGSYYMDNANTDKYKGYDFITDLMVGYEQKEHSIQLNVNNVFDTYYAMEVTKDTAGVETYKAATPRNAMITYVYKF
jgi:iron complex outermembrane receptor protein